MYDHRMRAIGVLTAAALLGAGCGGAHDRGSTAPERASVAPMSPIPVVRVKTPRGVVGISAQYFPTDILAAAGSIWLFAHRGLVADRIDPRTNRRLARIDLDDTLCTPAAFGGGLVWKSNCGAGEGARPVTSAIDPATNRVVRRIRGVTPVFAAGSIWTQSDAYGDRLLRFDPRTGVLLASIRSDEYLTGAAYGSVWLVGDRDITRISPATNRVTAVIPLAGAETTAEASRGRSGYISGGQMAFIDHKAWCANPAGLFEIDPRTNRAKLIPLRIHPFTQWGDIEIVSGAGSVWIRTTDSTIDRIDPASGKVARVYRADPRGGGGGIAVAFGSLWIANAGSGSVWREPLD